MAMQIAVAAQGFGPDFQGAVRSHIQKHLRPGQSVVECAIVNWQDVEQVKARLLGLLEGAERPAALVGICIRPDATTLARFREVGVPVVLIDERADGASTVASDNLSGGYLAGQHLVRQGRKSFAVVSGPVRDYNAMQRMRGVAKALSEVGLPLPSDVVLEAPTYSYRDGVAAMARLLEGPRKIDAVVCTAGDACAVGLLATAHERRVRIPEDIAVLGYDDSPLASTADPPLSTVDQSVEAISREALRLATEETAALLVKPRTVLLAPKLVLRATG